MGDNSILWQPSNARRDASAMQRFISWQGFDNYDDLYRWSIDQPAEFWDQFTTDTPGISSGY